VLLRILWELDGNPRENDEKHIEKVLIFLKKKE
jgi:hypothetical protein